MSCFLGLDIGSNSVGSAWIDLDQQSVEIAASVFPAGVDETDAGARGEPINAKRRMARRARITLARRAARKRVLSDALRLRGLLPRDPVALRALLDTSDPWELRRRGLREPLTPHEFGRVLLHLAQRRGALGLAVGEGDEVDSADSPAAGEKRAEEGKVKEAIQRTRAELDRRGCRTFGELIAALRDDRRHAVRGREHGPRGGPSEWRDPVRNRAEQFEFHADRDLIRAEFLVLWDAQVAAGGELAALLNDALKLELDDPDRKRLDGDTTTEGRRRAAAYKNEWRHGGLLFGQRRTWWDAGTLGRCVLHPSDRCVPIADRHASYFRVLETVNNIRIVTTSGLDRVLSADERERVIALLRGPLLGPGKGQLKGQLVPKKSASVSDIREALGLSKRRAGSKTSSGGRGSGRSSAAPDGDVRLNIEADADREINTDWFHREIVCNALGVERWKVMSEPERESVNRAILRFDPDYPEDADKLRAGAIKWWRMDADSAERLVKAWRMRPNLERRLKLSRRAIRNLLVIMEQPVQDARTGEIRWPTQIEARRAIAADSRFRDVTSGQTLDERTRQRYLTGAPGLTARDRYYQRQEKHWITRDGQVVCDSNGEPIAVLPPAPMLSNPVVRKAIHEVRRHVLAYLRKFGRKPDRIVIEMTRSATQPGKLRDEQLKRNRFREKQRKAIIEEQQLARFSLNQQRAAVDRVLLAIQQRQMCPYCGQAGLTPRLAASGQDVEIDHILPFSRCGNNSLSNKVLVHRGCNRNKLNQTPREWWGERFDELSRFAQRMFRDYKWEKGDYFTYREYQQKWANFAARELPKEWRGSQLTDTAYASRQVAAYLADALYGGEGLPERGGTRRIFFTKGTYTNQLRKDWQLFKTLKPPREANGSRQNELTAQAEEALAQKNRGDHREHALDAVAIALTDQRRIEDLAHYAQRVAIARTEWQARHGDTDNFQPPKREPVPPPWGSVRGFRHQVLSMVYTRFDSSPEKSGQEDAIGNERRLIVSHRPVKRKLVGALHEETLFGTVPGSSSLFTGRKGILSLSPNHLRVPEGWDALSAKLDDARLSEHERHIIRGRLAALPDPPPGKSGIVRDRALRDRLRKCLRGAGLDPERFTVNELKKAVEAGRLGHASGVPIKRVVLLRTMTDPVIVSRWAYDPTTGRRVKVFDADKLRCGEDPGDVRAARVYVGGNNHHIEIRQSRKTGKWSGEIVPTFDAARRVRLEKRPAVDRSDRDDSIFVMSLAEGETVYMKRPGCDYADYFVVFKLDKPQTIQFIHHWDARPSTPQKDLDGREIADAARVEIPVTASKLRDLAPPGFEHPVKVRISPIGNVTVLQGD